MNNSCSIKKFEFEFEIPNEKLHLPVSNILSRVINKNFKKYLFDILNKYSLNENDKIIEIDKIEIDIGEIYLNELNNIENLIKMHLDLKFYELASIRKTNIKLITLSSFLKDSSKNNVISNWKSSKEKLDILLSGDFQLKNNKVEILDLLTNNFALFKRIFGLFSQADFFKIIDKLFIDDSKSFYNILDLNSKVFDLFINDKSNSNKADLIYLSINQNLNYSGDNYLLESLYDTLRRKEIDIIDILNNYSKFESIIDYNFKSKLERNNPLIKKETQHFNLTNYQIKQDSNFFIVENLFRKEKAKYANANVDLIKILYGNDFTHMESFIEKIFSRSSILFEFLEKTKNKPNYIFLLSKLSVDNQSTLKLSRLNEVFGQRYFNIEKNLILLNQNIQFSNKTDKFLKTYFRFIHFKNLSINKDYKLQKEEFLHEILYDLSFNGSLFKKNKIQSILSEKDFGFQKTNFSNILNSVFYDYKFSNIPQKDRIAIFYKDLYYHFLENKNILPFWSSRDDISRNEILIFFKKIVKKRDKDFLKLLFSSETIIENFIIELINEEFDLLIEIISIISQDLINLNDDTFIYLTLDKNLRYYLLSFILKFRLWELNSIKLINDRLIEFFSMNNLPESLSVIDSKKSEKTYNIVLDKFKKAAYSQEINLFEIQLKKGHFSENDFLKIKKTINSKNYNINYYDILFKFSKVESILQLLLSKKKTKFYKSNKFKSLIGKIVKHLSKNKNDLKIILDFVFKNDVDNEILSNIFENKNIESIFNIKFKSPQTKIIFHNILLFVHLKKRFDILKDILSILIHLTVVNKYNNIDFFLLINDLNDYDFIQLFKLLFYDIKKSNAEKSENDNLINNIQTYPKNLRISSIDINKMIDRVQRLYLLKDKFRPVDKFLITETNNYNISNLHYDENNHTININFLRDYEYEINQEIISKNFSLLTYFIEFGSFPYDSNAYSFKQLDTFFQASLSKNIYLVKKHLFKWSRSETKLNRFFSIIFNDTDDEEIMTQKFKNLYDIIYPDFLRYFDLYLHFLIKHDFLLVDSKFNNNIIGSEKPIDEEIAPVQLMEDKEPIYKETEGYLSYEYKTKKNILKDILAKWSNYKFIIKDYTKFFTEIFTNQIELPDEEIAIKDFKFKVNHTDEKIKIYYRKILENINFKIKQKKDHNIEINKTEKIFNDLQEGIIIYNAGLLLYWPFLKTLFVKLSLLNDDKKTFKDEVSKDKAVLVTDFFVNGDDSSEKDFIFNKVLCGVELDKIIDTDLKLSDFEIDICKSATKALLDNWKKVKSVQTLRDWFLKREGRLIEKEDSFVIDVESRPPDIFLKSLSWGISVINYDLMQKKLIVNWNF